MVPIEDCDFTVTLEISAPLTELQSIPIPFVPENSTEWKITFAVPD